MCHMVIFYLLGLRAMCRSLQASTEQSSDSTLSGRCIGRRRVSVIWAHIAPVIVNRAPHEVRPGNAPVRSNKVQPLDPAAPVICVVEHVLGAWVDESSLLERTGALPGRASCGARFRFHPLRAPIIPGLGEELPENSERHREHRLGHEHESPCPDFGCVASV